MAPATIYNLVGPREQIWAALADDLLEQVEQAIATMRVGDPQARARTIAAIAADLICADPSVHRAVLSSWRRSGRLLRRDPTRHVRACLEDAADMRALRRNVDLDLLADMVATACTGAAHQWAAELIDDHTFRSRCVAAVDLVFAAAAAGTVLGDRRP